jgi:hypothetical protein
VGRSPPAAWAGRRVRGRRGGRRRGRGSHVGHPSGPAPGPAPPRDAASGPAAVTGADPAGALTVTGAQKAAFAVSLAVAVVPAGAAGLHTVSVAAPDGLARPVAVRQPRGEPGTHP